MACGLQPCNNKGNGNDEFPNCCVKRGTTPKQLVDGLPVELQVKGNRVPRTGKSSQG